MTIALGISHTPWIPERGKSFARLTGTLGFNCYGAAVRTEADGHYVRIFDERAPNWSWSEQMWRWGLETGAAHALFLQDDVLPAPNFWAALRAMLEVVADQVIGLEAAHPAGKRLALEGHRWYTTSDMLIGPGYVMPRASLAEFLSWRRNDLKRGAVEEISEDTLIGVWCLATGRKIWHPIPTVIDHDVTIKSVYNNDAHKHRRPSVTWEDGDIVGHNLSVVEDGAIPHLGRFYESTPHLARTWVRDFTKEQFEAAVSDTCPPPYDRWMK